MSDIVKAIDRTYRWVEEHGPASTYWAIDFHSTVLKPTYSTEGIATEFYHYAKEVLQMLSDSDEDVLIAYTSSQPYALLQYQNFFTSNGIKFKYGNENPEVKNSGHACFDNKFYFNVMLEDKAGFDPDEDWVRIYDYLKKRGL